MAFRVLRQEWWLDPDVQDWTPHKKLLWLYLQTNPKANQLGIYPFFPRYAALETGLDFAEIETLLSELADDGLVIYNKQTHEICCLNFFADQIVKGGASVTNCLQRNFESVKDRALIDAFIKHNEAQRDDLTLTAITFLDSITNTDGNEDEPMNNDLMNNDLMGNEGMRNENEETQGNTQGNTHKRIGNASFSPPNSDFETVWNLYPRKEGRRQAEQAFKQAVAEGVSVATILAGVERYAKYCDTLEDKRFIKSGKTFFIERAWMDEWKPIPKPLSGAEAFMANLNNNIFGNVETPIDTTAEEVDEHDEANEDDSCLYGNRRNVRLTQDEYDKLIAVFGERDTLFGINTVGYSLSDDEPNHFDKVYNYLHGYTGKG